MISFSLSFNDSPNICLLSHLVNLNHIFISDSFYWYIYNYGFTQSLIFHRDELNCLRLIKLYKSYFRIEGKIKKSIIFKFVFKFNPLFLLFFRFLAPAAWIAHRQIFWTLSSLTLTDSTFSSVSSDFSSLDSSSSDSSSPDSSPFSLNNWVVMITWQIIYFSVQYAKYT